MSGGGDDLHRHNSAVAIRIGVIGHHIDVGGDVFCNGGAITVRHRKIVNRGYRQADRSDIGSGRGTVLHRVSEGVTTVKIGIRRVLHRTVRFSHHRAIRGTRYNNDSAFIDSAIDIGIIGSNVNDNWNIFSRSLCIIDSYRRIIDRCYRNGNRGWLGGCTLIIFDGVLEAVGAGKIAGRLIVHRSVRPGRGSTISRRRGNYDSGAVNTPVHIRIISCHSDINHCIFRCGQISIIICHRWIINRIHGNRHRSCGIRLRTKIVHRLVEKTVRAGIVLCRDIANTSTGHWRCRAVRRIAGNNRRNNGLGTIGIEIIVRNINQQRHILYRNNTIIIGDRWAIIHQIHRYSYCCRCGCTFTVFNLIAETVTGNLSTIMDILIFAIRESDERTMLWRCKRNLADGNRITIGVSGTCQKSSRRN